MTPPRFQRLLVIVLAGACAITVAYWLVWFLGNRAWLATLDSPAYVVFENAFPAADGWMAVGFAAAAWTVRTRRPPAVFWLIASGSAAIYLGGMDVLFDLQNGVYAAPDTGAVITEIAINLASFAIGAWALWFGWHHRRWFLDR
jgi:hypothetical protein